MPAELDNLLREADQYYAERQWEQALERYQKALELEPNNGEACHRMAQVYAVRGMLNNVINTYFQLIDILEASGNLEGAVQVAEWIMMLRPESDKARMKLILIYQKRGDLAEVVRQSRELARLYIELGQGDQSIALLQKAQQADPENLDIGLELAEMYVSHGHIQDGANQYRKVANSFMDRQMLDKAAEAFRRMKVIVPDDPGVLFTLGNLYVELARYNEAEQEFRSILRHNLNHEEALLALGNVCQLKGQFRDAILAFNKILTINPEQVAAKEKLGELYQAQGLVSESIKNFQDAAKGYLEIDERDRAIRIYQIILGMDPSNPTACRELTNLGAPLVPIQLEDERAAVRQAAEQAAAAAMAASAPEESVEEAPTEAPPSRARKAREEGSPRPGLRPGLTAAGGAAPATGGLQAKGKVKKEGAVPEKPLLGSSSGPRPGLMRPGLAAGASQPGGDKPLLPRRKEAQAEAAEEPVVESAGWSQPVAETTSEWQPEPQAAAAWTDPNTGTWSEPAPAGWDQSGSWEQSSSGNWEQPPAAEVPPSWEQPTVGEPAAGGWEQPAAETWDSAPAPVPAPAWEAAPAEPTWDAAPAAPAEDWSSAASAASAEAQPPSDEEQQHKPSIRRGLVRPEGTEAPAGGLQSKGILGGKAKLGGEKPGFSAERPSLLGGRPGLRGGAAGDKPTLPRKDVEEAPVAEAFPGEVRAPLQSVQGESLDSGSLAPPAGWDAGGGFAPSPEPVGEGFSTLGSGFEAQPAAEGFTPGGFGFESSFAPVPETSASFGAAPADFGASAFGAAAPTPDFGSPTPAADFGQSSFAPTPDFGSPTPAADFGQSSFAPTPAADFGQSSFAPPATDFGTPLPAADFGQSSFAPETPATDFGQSSFAPETPATDFGQSSFAPPTPATDFGQSSFAPPTPATDFGQSSFAPPTPATDFGQSSFAPPTPAADFGQSSFAPPTPAADFGQSSFAPPTPAADFGQSSFAPPTPAADFGQSSFAPPTPAADFGQSSFAPPADFGAPPPAADFGQSSFAPPADFGAPPPAADFGQSSFAPPATDFVAPAPAAEFGSSFAPPADFGAPPAADFGQSSFAPPATDFGAPAPAAEFGSSFAPPATDFGAPAPAAEFGSSFPAPATDFGAPAPAAEFGSSFAPPADFGAPAPAAEFGSSFAAPAADFGAPAPAAEFGSSFAAPAADFGAPAPAAEFGSSFAAPAADFGAPAPAAESGSTFAPPAADFGVPAPAAEFGSSFGAPPASAEFGSTFGSPTGEFGQATFGSTEPVADASAPGSDFGSAFGATPSSDFEAAPSAFGAPFGESGFGSPPEGSAPPDFGFSAPPAPEAEFGSFQMPSVPGADAAPPEASFGSPTGFGTFPESGFSGGSTFGEPGEVAPASPEGFAADNTFGAPFGAEFSAPESAFDSEPAGPAQFQSEPAEVAFGDNPFATSAAPAMDFQLDLPPLPVVPLVPPVTEHGPAAGQLWSPPPLLYLKDQALRDSIKGQLELPPNSGVFAWEPLPRVDSAYLEEVAAQHQIILKASKQAAAMPTPGSWAVGSAFGEGAAAVSGGSFLERVQLAGGRKAEAAAGAARSVEGGTLAERLAARQKAEQEGAEAVEAAGTVQPELLPPQVEAPLELSIPEAAGELALEIPELEVSQPEPLALEPPTEPTRQQEPEPEPEIQQPEPEPEPEPQPEPEVLVALSIEQESPADHVARSQEIRNQAQDLDVTTAINLYRRAIEEQPENLVLRTDLADIHMNYGLLDDAVVQYRQIVMRKPQSVSLRHKLIQAHLWNDNFDEAAATLIEVADILIEHKMNQEALDSLQIVLSLDPHHFEARHKLVDRFNQMGQSNLAAHHLRQLAEGALTKGNVELAISAFNQLMEISDDPSLEDRLAQVYESQGNQEEALRHLRNLSHRYQEAQRWEDAANVTERIIAQDPDNLEMRRSLIATYEGLKWHDKVVAQQFELANFYYRQGDLNQALELFETVVQSRPDFHEARRGLADVYLDVGRIEEAIKHTDTLTQHYLATMDHQTAIALYARLVDALPENTELREKLIKFYEVAQDPQNALAQWLILAELHEQNARHEQAVTAYRKALDLDESRDDLHYRLALLYSEPLQNPTAALQELQRVHELNPGHVDAMERFVRMLLASGKAREGSEVILKLEKANKNGARVRQSVLDEFREKIEAEPTDLRTRFTYGETCFHLQALDMAIEQFQFTRRDQAYELPSYNMLGMCFAEKTGFNMLDLAIKQFRKGLETKGHSEQDYLELRYNLAMLQYRNNRLQEALQELKDCYAVDIAYRDVREWIRRIESEIAGGPKVPPSRSK